MMDELVKISLLVSAVILLVYAVFSQVADFSVLELF